MIGEITRQNNLCISVSCLQPYDNNFTVQGAPENQTVSSGLILCADGRYCYFYCMLKLKIR